MEGWIGGAAGARVSGFDPLCSFPSLGSSRSVRLWNGFRSSSFLDGVISLFLENLYIVLHSIFHIYVLCYGKNDQNSLQFSKRDIYFNGSECCGPNKEATLLYGSEMEIPNFTIVNWSLLNCL